MIISREELIKLCNELHAHATRIVFTNGCFDILHAGHVSYLSKARALGDILIVGVNTDDSVRRLKGHSRPINSESDRAQVLDALRSVDYVTLFNEDTPLELITALTPDIIAKGGDYTAQGVIGAEFVLANGGDVVIIPLMEGKSTSGIIEKIAHAG